MKKYNEYMEKQEYKNHRGYWKDKIEIGTKNESVIGDWLYKNFSSLADDIKPIKYNKANNIKQKEYGDYEIILKNGKSIYIECKSRQKKTNDLTFELIHIDDDWHIRPAKTDYYCISLPEREPLLVDFFIVQALFEQNKESWIKTKRKTKFSPEDVVFIPVDEFARAYNEITGLAEKSC